MNLFIDCEWNDWRGDLISIALVSAMDHEFYGVTYCEKPSQWVSLNVMPYLEKEPVPYEILQREMASWLMRFDSIHVIADWPEDISHFCNLLVMQGGKRFDTPPFTMEVCRGIGNDSSALLHNALHDARAIKASYYALRTSKMLVQPQQPQ